jgi:hypothetical protein
MDRLKREKFTNNLSALSGIGSCHCCEWVSLYCSILPMFTALHTVLLIRESLAIKFEVMHVYRLYEDHIDLIFVMYMFLYAVCR